MSSKSDKESAMNCMPYCARDVNRHTSIVLGHSEIKRRKSKRVEVIIHHIPLDSSGLHIIKEPQSKFDTEYKPFDYNVQQAAQKYLMWSEKYLGLTGAARTALSQLAKNGAKKMETQPADNGEVTKSTNPSASIVGVSSKSTAKRIEAQNPPTTVKDADVSETKKTKPAKKPAKKAASKTAAKPKKTPVAPPKPAPKAPAKKPAKVAAKKANGNGSLKLGRPFSMDFTLKIKKLSENPRREGSTRYKSFAAYKDGMTVGTALKHPDITSTMLHRDVAEGFVKLVR